MAESIFKIKVSNGLINIELEGKSEIVIEQFNEIRRAGLENFLTGGAVAKAPVATPMVEQPTEFEAPEKKKRGRKRKEQTETPNTEQAEEKKKGSRGRPKKVAEEQVIEAEITEKKRRGRPRKPQQEEISSEQTEWVAGEVDQKKETLAAKEIIAPEDVKTKAPKKEKKPGTAKAKTPKEKEATETADLVKVEAIAEGEQPKVAKTNSSRKKKEAQAQIEIKLNTLPTLQEVCDSRRPGPEREWILTYALYASDFGKKTISRDDIVTKYEETGRKDQSRINNLTNNIINAIKKGWIVNPEDKKLYITAEGIAMAYTIATRTAPIKEKRTGKAPKKAKQETIEPLAIPTEEAPVIEMPQATPENTIEVLKNVKKAKSKSSKKAKSKKKPVKKPVKKAQPEMEVTPQETPAADTKSPDSQE